MQGDHYTITSLGRDGKLGGLGLDADITSDNLNPKIGEMTFSQFLDYDRYNDAVEIACASGTVAFVPSYPNAKGMILTSILGGTAAFILCWLLLRNGDFTRQNARRASIHIAATMAISLILTWSVIPWQEPWGH